MDYNKIHDNIIANAKIRNLCDKKEQYFERHHIVPKCMGGSNEKENLVNLTAKEHFIIHRILCKIYPNVNGLKYAFFLIACVNFKNKKKNTNFI